MVLTGEAPGFGDPVGEGVGLVEGPGDGATVGLATGGLFGTVFAGGWHAPNTATLAAKIVDNIKDLLIVFLQSDRIAVEPQHRHHSRTDAKRLSATTGQNTRHPPPHTNTALNRTLPRNNLAYI